MGVGSASPLPVIVPDLYCGGLFPPIPIPSFPISPRGDPELNNNFFFFFCLTIIATQQQIRYLKKKKKTIEDQQQKESDYVPKKTENKRNNNNKSLVSSNAFSTFPQEPPFPKSRFDIPLPLTPCFPEEESTHEGGEA